MERDEPRADKPRAKNEDKTREAKIREAQTPEEREREGPLGKHTAGTAAGGVAGAVVAGAAAGSLAGPPGALIGAAVGAAVGGIAGKLAADAIDLETEDTFWRRNWSDRSYVAGGTTYDQDWGPAYRYGVDSFMRAPERHFREMETELAAGWPEYRGDSRLDWDRARFASLDAWQRARDLAERSPPEDAAPDKD